MTHWSGGTGHLLRQYKFLVNNPFLIVIFCVLNICIWSNLLAYWKSKQKCRTSDSEFPQSSKLLNKISARSACTFLHVWLISFIFVLFCLCLLCQCCRGRASASSTTWPAFGIFSPTLHPAPSSCSVIRQLLPDIFLLLSGDIPGLLWRY